MSHTVYPINSHAQPSSFSGRDDTNSLSLNCISLMLVMCKLFFLFMDILTSFATKYYACSLCDHLSVTDPTSIQQSVMESLWKCLLRFKAGAEMPQRVTGMGAKGQ